MKRSFIIVSESSFEDEVNVIIFEVTAQEFFQGETWDNSRKSANLIHYTVGKQNIRNEIYLATEKVFFRDYGILLENDSYLMAKLKENDILSLKDELTRKNYYQDTYQIIPDHSVHLMVTSPHYNVKKEYDEDKPVYLRLKRSDLYYEIGPGLDFYLPFFKLSLELKVSTGLRDVLVHDPAAGYPQYSNAIHKMKSQIWIVSFHFE